VRETPKHVYTDIYKEMLVLWRKKQTQPSKGLLLHILGSAVVKGFNVSDAISSLNGKNMP